MAKRAKTSSTPATAQRTTLAGKCQFNSPPATASKSVPPAAVVGRA